jgi:hypothetical protein
VKFRRILFILKLRENDYDCQPYSYGDGLSSGLYNSARMVVDMLVAAGVEAGLVQVTDNNDIDREVTAYQPDIVVIEGLWVVPEKFRELIPLHPRVRWIVRIHSEIPFLAMEGIALDWIARYLLFFPVFIACNSQRAFHDVQAFARESSDGSYFARFGESYKSVPADGKVLLLPNFYPVGRTWWQPAPSKNEIRIGCFGAIRPLKNQLIQAMAAVEFAAREKKRLRFYITVRDCEQGGDQVLKNIRALFAHTGNQLIERPWVSHEDFLGILDLIDVGMAVSLSESFCIVAADMVNAGVPVVVSPEIAWVASGAKANPTDSASIVYRLGHVTGLFSSMLRSRNRSGLADYSHESRETWLNFLKN